MSAIDGADSPKSWDNEVVEPVLSDLLGDTQNELSDDIFEQALAAVMESDSNLADESLIPAGDDLELTEDDHFVNPEEVEPFLDAVVDAEDDDEGEVEMEAEGGDDDHRDAPDGGGDDDHDFDFDDLHFGDDNSDDDFGGVLS